MNIRTHIFWIFISENLRPPIIFLVPSLVAIYSNSQPRIGTRKMNGRRKLFEIKFQKRERMFLID